ncbi:MAG TPA: chemotaxis protein CheA [Anaeromyxobacteraceae bacterium]|jgi:two-component system chemotaxis sensor kinase CheA|nr:chemotaxis protein CheA [Anaeromyxobacteraceae bacterium]
MDDVEIDWQLLADTFLEEAKEILAAMETLLMALEATPGDHELLNALFRAAHTLKGSAAMVDYRRVGEVAHHLEGLLQRLRSRDLVASSEVVSVLLQSVDVLREAIRRDRQQDATPHPEAEALKERIAALSQEGEGSPAPHAAPADRSGRLARVSRTLRVDVAKLDRLLDLSGEISVARGRFGSLLEAGEAPSLEELLAAHRESDRLYLDLQELIISARMVPIGPTFKQHLRTVRDLARAIGKQARLELEGETTEVDTAVVEHVRDPLLHMVRNSLDHGIEPPEVRRARGKDPCGVVTLRAFHEAGSIVVEVEDDGGGLPRGRIAERGRELGLVRDVDGLSDQEVQRLVFEPGFSTTEEVTDISGRGVGMDVVRRNVESLRGAVDVRSEEGKGTTFTMRLPLTLAIIQGFKVGIAGDTYIVPLDAVVECLELPAGAERGATGFFPLRGKPLPYLRLREHFGVAGAPPERENVLVVRHGAAVAGLAVDVLEGESQSVIKPLGALFHGLPGISGSSILGNGRVALILDVAGLLRELHRRSDGGAVRAAEARA